MGSLQKQACETPRDTFRSKAWNNLEQGTFVSRVSPKPIQSPAAPVTRPRGFSLTLPGIEWQLANAEIPVMMGSLNRKANT